jgi:hypothetical protein
MRKSLLVATFSDAEALLGAVRPLRTERLCIHEVYSPCPVHGLDEAVARRRTRLPWVTLFAGLTGLACAVGFQLYTTVLDWPLDVGGKPDNSALAFVPVAFELTVLFAGLATVAAFLLRSRLYPGKPERLLVPGVTDDVFALVVRRPEGSRETAAARALLRACGASEVTEVEA